MPLNVVATITAKPGSEQVVGDAMRELVVATRNEPGCLSYALYRSAADGTVYVTVEEWEGQADLDAHLQTPHLQKALAVAGDHLAEPPRIHPLQPAE